MSPTVTAVYCGRGADKKVANGGDPAAGSPFSRAFNKTKTQVITPNIHGIVCIHKTGPIRGIGVGGGGFLGGPVSLQTHKMKYSR